MVNPMIYSDWLYSSPPQLRYPQLRYFHRYTILNWVKKTRVKLFSFPPVTLFSSFLPQLHYFLCFRGKNSVIGGKNAKIDYCLARIFLDSIAQDIYYIKQTQSCAIFAAMLFWNWCLQISAVHSVYSYIHSKVKYYIPSKNKHTFSFFCLTCQCHVNKTNKQKF